VEDQTDLFVPAPAVLCSTQTLTRTERLLTLRRTDGEALGNQPGQFVQVSIFGMEEAPISICSVDNGEAEFELCVRRARRLTGALHELSVGDEVGIRGPYGRSFPVDELAGEDLLFIAGGIGLAPMRSLIQHCLARRDRFGGLRLLYGAKTPDELLFRDELDLWAKAEAFDVQCIVDAGDESWRGEVGLITALLEPLDIRPDRTVAVIIGPPVMYRFVIELLLDKGMQPERVLLSLERHMRCGVGKCGHCMIGDLYCCRDGPVFRLSELAGVEGAF